MAGLRFHAIYREAYDNEHKIGAEVMLNNSSILKWNNCTINHIFLKQRRTSTFC